MFSCAYSSFTCSFIYNICSIYPLTTVKTPSRNDMECCCHFHIESDTAPRHSVPGIQWKNVRSSHFFQHIQMDPGTFIFELHWVSSAIQYVSCAHLRTQLTHLRTELMVLCFGTFILNVISYIDHLSYFFLYFPFSNIFPYIFSHNINLIHIVFTPYHILHFHFCHSHCVMV